MAKFSHVIADIIKSAVERGSPVNAAPSAGELFRREHEAAMLLVKEKEDKKDEKKDEKKDDKKDVSTTDRSG